MIIGFLRADASAQNFTEWKTWGIFPAILREIIKILFNNNVFLFSATCDTRMPLSTITQAGLTLWYQRRIQ